MLPTYSYSWYFQAFPTAVILYIIPYCITQNYGNLDLMVYSIIYIDLYFRKIKQIGEDIHPLSNGWYIYFMKVY